MKVIPLPSETAAREGFNTLIVVTHEDLTEATAATAQTLAVLTVAPGDAVFRAATVLKTAFKNSADAAFNTNAATLGDGGDVDRLIASQELNENGAEVLYAVHPAATAPYVFQVADTIDLIVGSQTGKSLVNLDTGELHIYLLVARMADLSSKLKVA